jgi:hypothetical protein
MTMCQLAYQTIMNGRKYFEVLFRFLCELRKTMKNPSHNLCTSPQFKEETDTAVKWLSLLLHIWEVLGSNL